MSTKNINLLWSDFKGIRKLNTINSGTVLGADICHGVRLSKEKSGQNRSIVSSGWFNHHTALTEPVIRLFAANLSGLPETDQLIAFTKTTTNINAWLVQTTNTVLEEPVKIAEFPLTEDVYDVCMTQFGDRLVIVVAFGSDSLGFIGYFGDEQTDWSSVGSTGYYYKLVQIKEATTSAPVANIKQVCPYRSRLAINGQTTYKAQNGELVYGVWFSDAGNPTNFTMSYMTAETNTSAFYVETGGYINKLVEYHGLTAFGRNRSFNITGTTQNDYACRPLVAKGVVGNAAFAINGQCGYVDSFQHNIFALKDNIDGTIGFNFDDVIGDDIQNYLDDVKQVTINSKGRRLRVTKATGVSLVYDIDIKEWTTESFNKGARVETFVNREFFCDGTTNLYEITDKFNAASQQTPDADGYYSHYKTNLIWLDSQSSVKSHLYPLAIILEPNSGNDFLIKLTTDRGDEYNAHITKASFANIATYSANDDVPVDGSKFVEDDDDVSGHVFFAQENTDLLVTVERPPFWRYLTIEVYTTSPEQQFNISGIEAKNVFLTDEMLDY